MIALAVKNQSSPTYFLAKVFIWFASVLFSVSQGGVLGSNGRGVQLWVCLRQGLDPSCAAEPPWSAISISSRPMVCREIQAAEQDGALSTKLISALGAFLHHQPRALGASTGPISQQPEIH